MKQYKTQIGNHHTEDGYEQLANAIIVQAVKDYRNSLKRLKKHPYCDVALTTKLDTEQFFHSVWFTALTDIDPDGLIRRLNTEAA